MYKSLGTCFVLILLLKPLILSADEDTGVYLGMGINSLHFSEDAVLEDESDLYFLLGYQITDHWGVELETSNFDTEVSPNSGIDFSTRLTSINAKYRYQSRRNDSMFWKFGAGEYNKLPATNDTTIGRLGIGYEWANEKTISLHVGADGIFNFDENHWDTNLYFGGVYYFGKTSKPKPTPVVPPPPKDSDKDGVIDSQDQCPNSPPNVKVDSRGCELDSDGDGVKNSVDKCLATPQGAKVDDQGCRIILEKDVSITLKVNFANDSDVITPNYRSEIQKVADFMRQYPDTNVVIEGHTDDRGAASYNQQLSERRAKAVMQFLVTEFRLSESRLSAIGVGEASPIATNSTSEGRAQNRRVQAEIKTTVKEAQ